jgi:succinyl-CoA synthetase beta subunit
MPYQGRELAFKLGLEGKQVQQFTKIFMGLATIFLERDLALIEINPLVITTQGDLICLDGKLGAGQPRCSASRICAKCATSLRKIRVKRRLRSGN